MSGIVNMIFKARWHKTYWPKAGAGILLLLAAFFLFLYRPDLPAQEVEARWRLPDSRFLTMPNGLRVHYRHLEASRKRGTKKLPLLFIHGSGSSLHSWNAWAARLHEQQDVWLVDLPGAGLTGPAKKRQFRYTIPDYADFVLRFMHESGINKAIMAGHSVGGEIAWFFASQHPEKVVGLILVAPTGYPVTPPLTWRIGKMAVLGDVLEKVTPRWIVKMNLHEAFAQDERVREKLVRRYQDLVRRAGNRQALHQQMRHARLQYWPRLKRLKMPVLLLWGREDIWLPVSLAQRFVHDVPQAQLKVYRHAGHALPEEHSRAIHDVCHWLMRKENIHVGEYFEAPVSKC